MRPSPPPGLLERNGPVDFAPAPDLASWIAGSFIDSAGSLTNPDHEHLRAARIACLWTNAEARSKGRVILATAEIPQAKGWGFSKARQEVHNLELCGGEVDFLLTFSAPLTAALDDPSFCALVEHELYHCGQARDRWGGPRFTREGRPVFSMRGHDSEEFVGVVRRYGVGAVDSGTRRLVEAAVMAPEVARASVAAACGTCLARAA